LLVVLSFLSYPVAGSMGNGCTLIYPSSGSTLEQRETCCRGLCRG